MPYNIKESKENPLTIRLLTTGESENGRWRQQQFFKSVDEAISVGNSEMRTDTEYNTDGYVVVRTEHEDWKVLWSSLPGHLELIHENFTFKFKSKV